MGLECWRTGFQIGLEYGHERRALGTGLMVVVTRIHLFVYINATKSGLDGVHDTQTCVSYLNKVLYDSMPTETSNLQTPTDEHG
jgi:hypothetical protein